MSVSTLPGCRRKSARKPNVVLILTDDQGTLDAHCYGAADLFTPTMDGLAETGVRFTQAYSHTVCCPARALLMTGRHPQRCGVNSWVQGNTKDEKKGRNMFRSEITLAEVLKGSGYRTGLFGKWHLGAHVDHGPMEQGFDEFLGLRDGFIDNYNHCQLHGNGYHDLYEGTREIFREGEYFPDIITGEAVRFVRENRDRPFLLYLAFNIPHYPEQSDNKFDGRYADLPEPRRSYAKMISTTDDRMGRVVKEIEKLGLRDDTIFIMLSDNGHSPEDYKIRGDNHVSGLPKGANYGANGGGGFTGKWRGAKGSFFEGGIRLPAIISYPKRLPEGAVRDQAVIAADWFPTVLDLCEIPLPDVELDGRSLLPIMRSSDAPSPHEVMYWQWQEHWAVREGNWKLIVNGRDSTDPWQDVPVRREKIAPVFLGNLAEENPEFVNHAEERPEIVARLTALHEKWVKEVMP